MIMMIIMTVVVCVRR